MTIFNNSFSEIDNSIISFLPIKEQITFSGVNTIAYSVLSNDPYFKKLFTDKLPCFQQVVSKLFIEQPFDSMRMDFKRICKSFPDNCWKIFCYVFHTGNTKFNRSSLEELLQKKLNQLTKEQNDHESRLKNICGSFYEDPSSPIHQAWQAYQENQATLSACTKEMKKVFPSSYLAEIIGEREEEWEAILADIEEAPEPEREAVFANIKTFDERLIPFIDFMATINEATIKTKQSREIYYELENQRRHIVGELPRLTTRIDSIKDPANKQLHLSIEQEEFNNSFKQALRHQLDTALSSSQGTQKDIETIYAAFKYWAAVAYPQNLLYAINDISHSPSITAMLKMFSDDLFIEAIKCIASRPSEDLTSENIGREVYNLSNFFHQMSPRDILRQLGNAIIGNIKAEHEPLQRIAEQYGLTFSF